MCHSSRAFSSHPHFKFLSWSLFFSSTSQNTAQACSNMKSIHSRFIAPPICCSVYLSGYWPPPGCFPPPIRFSGHLLSTPPAILMSPHYHAPPLSLHTQSTQIPPKHIPPDIGPGVTWGYIQSLSFVAPPSPILCPLSTSCIIQLHKFPLLVFNDLNAS